jgi:uncharacterized protein (TIGR03437 family)
MRLKVLIWLAFGFWGGTLPLASQTTQTVYFRAVLLPTNEVPSVSSSNRAVADVAAHVVLDSTGQVVSGTVNVISHVTFTAAVAVTGMDIWKGASGQNGSVVISTGFNASNAPTVQTGGDLVQGPASVAASNAVAMAALRDLLQNPGNYYVNILTATSPAGAVRGQLQPAQTAVLLAMMSTANMNPAPSLPGYGVAQIVAIGTQNASGVWTSGELFWSAAYSTQDLSSFTSFQIHQGTALPTAAGALTATLPGGLMPDPSGAGNFGPYYSEITTTTAAQTAAFTALFTNPSSLYVDLHSAANPSGLMLAPLRQTDAMSFPVVMSSANNLSPPSVTASAPANFTLYTLRGADGSVLAGTVLNDVDYSFPGATQFIGLDLQTGSAQQAGPVVIEFAPDFYDPTGIGNYYQWSPPIQDINTLAAIIANPQNYYVNLHTTADPAGAIRGQLSAASSALPAIGGVLAADLDTAATTLAPGELFSIFGSRLVNVGTGLNGWAGQTLPISLNGASVSVALRRAALLFVAPGQINAQVPLDTPLGPQTLVVTSPNGATVGFTVQIAAAAPAIFFSPLTAVLNNSNYSLVTTANPAKPGDTLLVYCTGLGQTNPAQSTGVISSTLAYTASVTATMGGKPATVIYSIASPSFPGLYQVAVTVPAGLTGSVPLVLQEGSATSNSVPVALK